MIKIEPTHKGDIEFSLSGSGKTNVLIVHGGHVDCREQLFLKDFDMNLFHFITPSRPGYGKTPLTDENKTARGTADLFDALLAKLNYKQVIVIGISAGGLTAIELAANYPQRVERLILMSALTKRWFDKNDRTYRGGKLVFSPHIQSLTWHAYRIAFSLLEKFTASVMFKALSNWRPVEITDDELSEIKKLTLNMNSGSGFSNDLDQDVLPGTLGKITCDTLIIHSAYDNSVDTSHALHAKENIPRSQLVLIKNRWGHMLWIGREYQETMEILGRCLNDQHRDRGR